MVLDTSLERFSILGVWGGEERVGQTLAEHNFNRIIERDGAKDPFKISGGSGVLASDGPHSYAYALL